MVTKEIKMVCTPTMLRIPVKGRPDEFTRLCVGVNQEGKKVLIYVRKIEIIDEMDENSPSAQLAKTALAALADNEKPNLKTSKKALVSEKVAK